MFHIEETAQPQGHSTSGSHERYNVRTPGGEKNGWIRQMRQWIITNALAEEDELNEIGIKRRRQFVRECKQPGEKYSNPIKALVAKPDVLGLLPPLLPEVKKLADELAAQREPMRRDIMKTPYARRIDLAESKLVSAGVALHQ